MRCDRCLGRTDELAGGPPWLCWPCADAVSRPPSRRDVRTPALVALLSGLATPLALALASIFGR